MQQGSSRTARATMCAGRLGWPSIRSQQVLAGSCPVDFCARGYQYLPQLSRHSAPNSSNPWALLREFMKLSYSLILHFLNSSPRNLCAGYQACLSDITLFLGQGPQPPRKDSLHNSPGIPLYTEELGAGAGWQAGDDSEGSTEGSFEKAEYRAASPGTKAGKA